MTTLNDAINSTDFEMAGMDADKFDRYLKMRMVSIDSDQGRHAESSNYITERRKVGKVLRPKNITTMGDLKNLGMEPI